MEIHVQLVRTLIDLHEVQSFAYDRYRTMGYCEQNKDRMLNHHQRMDLTSDGRLNQNYTEVVFVRDRVGAIIGTCSMTIDSDRGLPTDLTFPNETDAIREECRPGHKLLGAVWRLATAEHQRRVMVGTLIDSMVEWAHRNDVEVCLAALNPHHARFYSRFLAMVPVAQRDTEVGLQNAPVVLMRWDWSVIEAWSTLGARMLPENPQI